MKVGGTCSRLQGSNLVLNVRKKNVRLQCLLTVILPSPNDERSLQIRVSKCRVLRKHQNWNHQTLKKSFDALYRFSGDQEENGYSLPIGAGQQPPQQPYYEDLPQVEGVPLSDLSSWNSSEDKGTPEKPTLGFFAAGVKKSPGKMSRYLLLMVCLGLEPVAAGWMAQTIPLSYGGTPYLLLMVPCGQFFMTFTIVNYDSRLVPSNLKIAYIALKRHLSYPILV